MREHVKRPLKRKPVGDFVDGKCHRVVDNAACHKNINISQPKRCRKALEEEKEQHLNVSPKQYATSSKTVQLLSVKYQQANTWPSTWSPGEHHRTGGEGVHSP
jgi:hypothetical protein